MKAVINEKVTQKQKGKYPYLGTSTNNEGKSNVVLFIAHNEGTVVQSDCNNTWPLGEYDTSWAEDNAFTPFTGSITLSND